MVQRHNWSSRRFPSLVSTQDDTLCDPEIVVPSLIVLCAPYTVLSRFNQVKTPKFPVCLCRSIITNVTQCTVYAMYSVHNVQTYMQYVSIIPEILHFFLIREFSNEYKETETKITQAQNKYLSSHPGSQMIEDLLNITLSLAHGLCIMILFLPLTKHLVLCHTVLADQVTARSPVVVR